MKEIKSINDLNKDRSKIKKEDTNLASAKYMLLMLIEEKKISDDSYNLFIMMGELLKKETKAAIRRKYREIFYKNEFKKSSLFVRVRLIEKLKNI